MNKIATYLNEHLLGEATASKAVRKRMSRDGGILTITPEIVVFPRVTNDIRKVARFTWQLAEKGHPMTMTVRGRGGDTTGASIGKGIILDTSVHLNKIMTISVKDRLAHVQPGISFDVLQNALSWQGLTIANAPYDTCHSTVGGAIATGSLGETDSIAPSIKKLEIILANGDIIETGRLSRGEVNKKLGLQTFEGEIYRKLSGLLEDNEALVAQLAQDMTPDTTAYRGITRVKQKDGSMDLTPLIIGSQGTLGIISEVVLTADFYSEEKISAVIVAETDELARDLADRITELNPSSLLTIESELLNRARAYGKHSELLGDGEQTGTLLYLTFDDFNDRARRHKLKKLQKLASKLGISMIDSHDHDQSGFDQLRDIVSSFGRIAEDDKVALPILDGSYIPVDRREEFTGAIRELATKQHVSLPTITNVLTGIVTAYPQLKLDVVSDKQKIFRLMSEYAAIVHKCNGAVTSDGAEGRLKAPAAWSVLDDAEVALYEGVREVFDPFKTLNPGVKQKVEVRTLVASLRTSYDTTDSLS